MSAIERSSRLAKSTALFVAVWLTWTVGCKRQPQISTSVLTTGDIEKVSSELNYDNFDPSVAYVEDSACAPCHAEIVDEFARHPMGRSLAPVTARQAIEKFDDQARAEFDSGPFRYAVSSDGDHMFHSRMLRPIEASPTIEEVHELAFAVGSGQKGRSYLINHENRLFMSPLTWYPEKQIWDLSPGYETNDLGFDRPVLEDCLFCHSNQAHTVPDAKNQYAEPMFSGHAIGCQRCHGPGELHVQRHSSGAAVPTAHDRSIVNPARLDPALREAVCQQCHLTGAARVTRAGMNRFDFRPGKPLSSVIATFQLAPSQPETTDHFVGQVEQMYESRCFTASNGTLGCISCHDPHTVPDEDERVMFYRARCLRCHTDDSCGLALSRRTDARGDDNCISCHMPQGKTDVRHAATTNHRIPRTPEAPRPVDNRRYINPIITFPPRSWGDEIDEQRNLALGLIQASQYHPQRVTEVHLEKMVLPLRQAVARNPLDVEAAEGLADLLLMLGRADAVGQYRTVLRQHPDREHSLVKLADAISRLDRSASATELWQSASELNPWMASYQQRWGESLARDQRWNDVHKLAAVATKQFPTSPRLWHLLVESHLRRGEQQAAQLALKVLVRLQPDAAEEIQQWFDDHPLRSTTVRE